MLILIIGGHGTIGRKVSERLSAQHEILIAGRSEGYYAIDITDNGSIERFFQKVGNVDAIINIAGEAKWAPFDQLTEEDYYVGIRSKLMGQVNLVRIGRKYLNDNGSIVLSTGILADRPVPMTSSAAMVNGGINSFVRAAGLEMDRGHRINVVSLGLVEDSAVKYGDFFAGHEPITMDQAASAYERCIEEDINGEVVSVY